MVDVVRYDSDKKLRARYRLKHPREIRQVITALSNLWIRLPRRNDVAELRQLRKYATNVNGS